MGSTAFGMIGKLYTNDGPFVSVYLDSTSAVENARFAYETRWRNVERELAEAVAAGKLDQATADAVLGARGEHGEGDTRVVIASHGSVRLARSLPGSPGRDVVRVSALPHVAPLVDRVSAVRPHVVALIDRTGADVYAYTDSDTEVAEFATVQGDAPDIRKVHGAGGWQMRHMQARAEEGWEHNAKEIADTVRRVSHDIGAELIVAAGDTREIGLVRDELPAEFADVFEQVPGGRSEDGSSANIFEHVADRLEERRTRDVTDLLGRFEQNRGRHSLAADGLAETAAALRSGQVDTLLLNEDYTGEEPLWFGPEAVHIATTRDDLVAMGVEGPQQTEAIDPLLRAAVATGAAIVRVPGGLEQSPSGGIGAVLRFDLES